MVCNKNECRGCMACLAVCNENAIHKEKDNEGFLYPVIDDIKCKKCKKCLNICPVLNPVFNEKRNIKKCYAAYSRNIQIQRDSSSGGLFSEIASSILEQNGVIFGAAFTDSFNVCHIDIDTNDALHLLRGSKYVQSDINNCYLRIKQYLENNRKVLFSGTPCQIAGLYAYLNKEFDLLYTIDIVCHGTPSPLIFFEYKNWLEKKYGKMISFSFRDKKYSWKRFNIKAVMEQKTYYGTWEEDPYMRGFLRDYYLRMSCHSCKYAVPHRLADITLADFWGYKSRRGKFRDQDNGMSMVLINTIHGECLFDSTKRRIHYIETPLSEAINGNRALSSCFPPSKLRDKFWNDFQVYGFEKLIEKYLYPEKINIVRMILYKYGKDSIMYFFVFRISQVFSCLRNSIKKSFYTWVNYED